MADDEKKSTPAAVGAGKNGYTGPARQTAISNTEEGTALLKQGRIAEAMRCLDAAVLADPGFAPAHLNRGNALLAGERLDEARAAYEAAIACDPHYAIAHFNLGNLHYRAGELAQAVQQYQKAIASRSEFPEALVAMASALFGLGRAAEASDSCQRALAINPEYVDAHFNLGVFAGVQEQLGEAVARLRRAVELRPDHAPAYRMLGAVYSSLGNLDAAETSLRRAAALRPDAADALYELAMLLQHRGKYQEAVQLLSRALQRVPNWISKLAFGACAARTRFTQKDALVRATLTTAMTEAWAAPQDLCQPALSAIMLDESISGCVRRANDAWPARPPGSELFGNGGLQALAADLLLHALLEAIPVSSIQFERFLTCARAALLGIAAREGTPDGAQVAGLGFFAALSRQCFLNEFLFDSSEEEKSLADGCRARLLALLDGNKAVPPVLLLAVAAYFPLHTLPEPTRLFGATAGGPVDGVIRQQIREPLAEERLRCGISRLTRISASSEAVREQYEQNPYPRWEKIQRYASERRFNAELQRTLPFSNFVPLSDDSAPDVLIGGCGTGGDAIFEAQRFQGARVLAIDLSLSSLSFAKRKTEELGLHTIEYAQADILELGRAAVTFDVIGSVGVLHHLEDPFEGCRVLLSRLRDGGFMCLGLYSQTARRLVADVRAMVAARAYKDTPEDIRRFRQDIQSLDESSELRLLTRSQAFYSMSECRDLAFHVREKHLTLAQIDSFLKESGLRFIGFELDFGVLAQYRTRFADDPACVNLGNWALFEADNPNTFTAMYRFWVQKPPAASAADGLR
jgi:tetratricopeptide (TPR) repeat protein/2-polyprenyl-3-methyl-5-hydroxy-6-metoxy-1,4-benzoquinol methylase